MFPLSKNLHFFNKLPHFPKLFINSKNVRILNKMLWDLKNVPFLKNVRICLFLVFFSIWNFSINVFTNLKRNHVFDNLFANSKYVRGIWKNVLISKFCFINLKMFCNFKKSSSLFNFVHILKQCSCFLNFLKKMCFEQIIHNFQKKSCLEKIVHDFKKSPCFLENVIVFWKIVHKFWKVIVFHRTFCFLEKEITF